MFSCDCFMLITLLLVLSMNTCIPQLTIILHKQCTEITFPSKRLSSYLTLNTERLHYTDDPIDVVEESSSCLL
jgi:hypothetical protein